MSGGYVAYNQRPNKAVERHLFVDLLVKLNRQVPIQNYIYIGFGGAYFEDFKLVHSYFDNKKMISLEGDPDVYRRQKFNLPYKCINPLPMMSDTYINQYNAVNNCIIWLDYVEPNQYLSQLGGFHDFLTKALVGDIVKITLNANPTALKVGDPIDRTINVPFTEMQQKPKRIAAIKKMIDEYIPEDPTENDVTIDGLPLFLSKTIGNVASIALSKRLDHGGVMFQPLTAYHYADSKHQMMTLTGILIRKEDVEDIITRCSLKTWKLAALEWGTSHKIMVPNLTHKEKTFIDEHIHGNSFNKLVKKVKFKLDGDDDIHREFLEGYIKYYRYFPSFHRVMI